MEVNPMEVDESTNVFFFLLLNADVHIDALRVFTSENSIPSYFTIPKSHFINYIIQFYNTPNIPTFIFLFYSLK